MDLNEVVKKMKDQGFTDVEIERCLRILKKIYIGQHIREPGILQSDFVGFEKEIKVLRRKLKLIKEGEFYSHQTFSTTENGRNVAIELVKRSLQRWSNVIDLLTSHRVSIPISTLQFLIFDYIATKLTFPVGVEEDYAEGWRRPIVNHFGIRVARDKLLSTLEKEELCVRTRMYVSTRGGELREEEYVISPEIQQFLKENWAVKGGIDEEKIKKAKLYEFLNNKCVTILTRYEDIDRIRELFWESLKEAELSESDIKPLIEKMANNGITSHYNGILSDKKPFEIKDEIRYKFFLERELLKPLMDEILEVKEKDTWKIKLPQPPLSKEDQKLKDSLIFLEEKMREFIFFILKKEFGDEWRKMIPKDVIDQWEKFRKRKVEKDLEDYPDLGQQKQIILYNWKIFKNIFEIPRKTFEVESTLLKDVRNKVHKVSELAKLSDEVKKRARFIVSQYFEIIEKYKR